jgi:hypothetical protein
LSHPAGPMLCSSFRLLMDIGLLRFAIMSNAAVSSVCKFLCPHGFNSFIYLFNLFKGLGFELRALCF